MDKIAIWGENIPYNSTRSKLDDMVIDYKRKKNTVSLLRFLFLGILGNEFKDNRRNIDTWTYLAQIKGGFEKETYEDVPYITPFLVPDSKRVVLVVPGGGFSYKQSDLDGEGKQAEGDLVATELNKAGISAFVLWYRTNPYSFPVPLMDMQRAVRYIRFHADEFGIDPDKISAIGFSGGGYEIAGLINILHGENVIPEGYTPDEVDAVSDRLETAGLIYPCVSFKHLMPMMTSCFSFDQIDTEEKRRRMYDKYSCVKNFCSQDIPQFFCYGGKDMAIPPAHELEYVEKLRSTGTDHEVLLIPSANHGFGCNPKMMKKYGYWMQLYVNWYKVHTN